MILIVVFLGLLILSPLVALVEVIRSNFRGEYDKLMWVIIIVFMNVLGAVLYVAVGRSQRVA